MDETALHGSFALTDPVAVSLGQRELHIWAVPLRGEPEALLALLSDAERDRASRFHFVDHRRRYEVSHGALRQILGGYLNTDPTRLAFGTADRGKPFLSAVPDGVPNLQFNLSHSGKLAMIGVAQSELGVDCEKLRPFDSYQKIAEKHFSPDEFRALQAVSEAERLPAFYRCWTRKEAYMKALGEGLSMALDSFDVSLAEEPRLLRCRNGEEDVARWSMLDVSPGPDFVAACAVRHPEVTVKCFRLDVG